MRRVYIAKDGRQFNSEDACERYEIMMTREKMEEAARKENEIKSRLNRLMCFDTDYTDLIPLTEHYFDPDIWQFRWYISYNHDDYEFLCGLVDSSAGHAKEPDNYPAFICLASEDDDITHADWMYSLDECIKEAKGFFKCFGYKCTISDQNCKGVENVNES